MARGRISSWGPALALAVTACSVDASDDDPCQAASEHIAACEGTSPQPLDACDPVAAASLLDTPCEELAGAPKSDAIGSLLCSLGLLRHCEVPTCEEALPLDHDFSDMRCADLSELDGCAACDYYRCREAQSAGQCGEDGYYLGFGHQYCLRYRQVTEPKMSEIGQQWSARTRRCLMEILDADIEDTADCEALEEAGYDSHLDCYSGSGFCDLSLSDRTRLFQTIDPEDRDFDLMGQILGECLED